MYLPRQGFTLIELLTAVAVVAVLVALAAPSFVDQIGRRRLEGVANELGADLFFAQTEAVSKNTQVQLTSDSNGTAYSINYVTAPVTPALKTRTLPTGVSSSASTLVVFEPLRGSIASAINFDLVSTQTAATLRASVNPAGRVTLCSPGANFAGYATC